MSLPTTCGYQFVKCGDSLDAPIEERNMRSYFAMPGLNVSVKLASNVYHFFYGSMFSHCTPITVAVKDGIVLTHSDDMKVVGWGSGSGKRRQIYEKYYRASQDGQVVTRWTRAAWNFWLENHPEALGEARQAGLTTQRAAENDQHDNSSSEHCDIERLHSQEFDDNSRGSEDASNESVDGEDNGSANFDTTVFESTGLAGIIRRLHDSRKHPSIPTVVTIDKAQNHSSTHRPRSRATGARKRLGRTTSSTSTKRMRL